MSVPKIKHLHKTVSNGHSNFKPGISMSGSRHSPKYINKRIENWATVWQLGNNTLILILGHSLVYKNCFINLYSRYHVWACRGFWNNFGFSVQVKFWKIRTIAAVVRRVRAAVVTRRRRGKWKWKQDIWFFNTDKPIACQRMGQSTKVEFHRGSEVGRSKVGRRFKLQQ